MAAAASPLALLAATCSKIGSVTAGSASEHAHHPHPLAAPTPLAESLVARSISKSLEEERRNRERSRAAGLPLAPAGLVQVGKQPTIHWWVMTSCNGTLQQMVKPPMPEGRGASTLS